MRVLDDLAQLVEDQPRLEFQGGCQRMGDGEQSRLFAHPGFDLSAQALLCLDAPADIPDDAQQARPATILDHRSAYLDVKRRTIPAYVDDERFEYATRFRSMDLLPETRMVLRKQKDCWI